MKTEYTIIIPTYNGEHRIAKCLEGISKLIFPENVPYEIIVIDNNCTDNTISVVNSFKINNLRVIKEETQGLLYARYRGIKEASSNWIFFIDDDMKVESNWVISFLDLAKTNKDLGLAAAKLKFPDDYKIPQLINDYSEMYAVTKKIETKLFFLSSMMFLSKECFYSLIDKGYEQKLIGRSKNPYESKEKVIYSKYNAGGEDIEYSLSLQYTKYKCYENDKTIGYHYLDKTRLNKENLIILKEANAYILFKIAPYRYVINFGNFTSYYFYLFRTIISLPKILFLKKDNREIFLIEKLGLLRHLFFNKKEYQDFEEEIRNAKWNIYSKNK